MLFALVYMCVAHTQTHTEICGLHDVYFANDGRAFVFGGV